MIAATVGMVAFILASGGLFHRNSRFAVIIEAAFVATMSALMIVVHLVL